MKYFPTQGDIIWLDFDPQTGNEQRGRRPAVVVTNKIFNNFAKTGAMVCPITNTDKNIPIRIKLDDRTKTKGNILTDHAKILDLAQRNAEFIEVLPKDILHEVVDVLHGFIEV